MAYSDKKATEIEWLARHIGIEATALQLEISEKSVKRACQYFEKRELGKPKAGARQLCNKALAEPEKPFMQSYEAALRMSERLQLKNGSTIKFEGTDERCEVGGNPVIATEVKRLIKEFHTSKQKGSRVLCIGDIHAPFDLDSYFDFCCSIYDQYNCDKVVFIGDVIDNHYSSYHETDADGMGGGNELNLAKKRLERWNNRFPEATVITGNHDRLIMRKAQTSAIPREWIKAYKDVLDTPDWNFTERTVIDGVQYIHGEGGTARTKSRKDLMSTVQGHLHAQAYTEWTVGAGYKIFGCQVGCGIDHESYAMGYAKNFSKPAIGCAVIINGKTCINELMEL
jgi:metallophosphoesterase superfamily enzyme